MSSFKAVKRINLFSKWWFRLTAFFLLLFLLIIGADFCYGKVYQQKIYLGVKVSNLALGDLPLDNAFSLLQKNVDNFSSQGLTYKYGDKIIRLSIIISSASDPDLTYNLASFDIEKTLEQAQKYGRSGNYFIDLKDKIIALLNGKNILLEYDLNEEELLKTLRTNFYEFTTPAENASYKIKDDQIIVQPEKSGEDFDYQAILKKTQDQINNLNNQPISLSLIADYPQVYQEEVTPELIGEVKIILDWSKIILSYQNQNWEIERNTYQDWFIMTKQNDQVVNQFNDDLLTNYLEEEIVSKINQEVQDAKFTLKNGKVTEFQAGHDGQKLIIDQTINKINQEVFSEKKNKIDLIVDVIPTKSQVGNINDLGIREIIGIGQSNFAGSPPNRIYNIRVGSTSLNGVLIEPNETFSLVKALGTIDASTGYKQELVIKGDKTIPEYGGGLCQIGTTTFRVALASGLPIIERHNHAYRVVYYEPAGVDATIYDPKPDLRFLNDTGHYILIQTKISGNNLIFEFWGTKDGRLIEQTKPVIYNITPPGPTKIIESEDLKPDERKCIEKPHYGADAYFNYKITYPNGEIKEEVFRSHYIPWPEVCLVGKSPTLPGGENQLSTSTPIININTNS